VPKRRGHWGVLADRLAVCKLALHPEKTKIVYCKDANRRDDFPSNQSFDLPAPEATRDRQPVRARSASLVALIEPFTALKRENDPVAEPWTELTATQATLIADTNFGEGNSGADGRVEVSGP
jgi:hypothetical protein